MKNKMFIMLIATQAIILHNILANSDCVTAEELIRDKKTLSEDRVIRNVKENMDLNDRQENLYDQVLRRNRPVNEVSLGTHVTSELVYSIRANQEKLDPLVYPIDYTGMRLKNSLRKLHVASVVDAIFKTYPEMEVRELMKVTDDKNITNFVVELAGNHFDSSRFVSRRAMRYNLINTPNLNSRFDPNNSTFSLQRFKNTIQDYNLFLKNLYYISFGRNLVKTDFEQHEINTMDRKMGEVMAAFNGKPIELGYLDRSNLDNLRNKLSTDRNEIKKKKSILIDSFNRRSAVSKLNPGEIYLLVSAGSARARNGLIYEPYSNTFKTRSELDSATRTRLDNTFRTLSQDRSWRRLQTSRSSGRNIFRYKSIGRRR